MIHPFLSWLFIQRKQKWTGDVCTSMFTAALFTITKTWTLPESPLKDEWIQKNVIDTHTQMECYSAIKKKELLPFVTTWMDLQDIILSEISQRKLIPYDLTCMWNPNKQKNPHRHKKQIGSYKTQVVMSGDIQNW